MFPGDATSLRQTLLSLVRDRDIRRRFGEAGRRRVEALFSRSVLAQNSVGYYWRIIAANGAEKP